MMIAQLTADMVKDIAPWLVCLGAFLWIWNQGAEAVRNFKGKTPHPPNETLDVTQQNLSGRIVIVESGLSEARKQMSQSLEAHRQESSRGRAAIYEKIDSVRKELQADLTAQTSQLKADMNQVPHQIMALLRNAGIIK